MMTTVGSVQEMQRLALEWRRAGRRIGFVPTMGYLHEGHISLVRRARAAADVVVVSLFVNPTQFGPKEDFEKYPRDLERDSRLCREAGTDVLFCPTREEMYPAGSSIYVDEERLSKGLCGASRPGHFRGVATVVAKLFNIVLPDVAVFGQKDAQQVRVIRQLVRDLNFPVILDVAPIVRDPDGLAMSSRNAYLSPEERRRGLCLSRGLAKVQAAYIAGERSGDAFRQLVLVEIAATPGVELDYVDVVDDDTLAPVDRVERPALVAVAVRVGKTRLIDNVVIGLPAGATLIPVPR